MLVMSLEKFAAASETHKNKRLGLGFKKQIFNHSTGPNYFRKPLSSNVTFGQKDSFV